MWQVRAPRRAAGRAHHALRAPSAPQRSGGPRCAALTPLTAQLASPPPLPPSSGLAPRPASLARAAASLGAAAAPSENTPPPPGLRATFSYGAAGAAKRPPAASPAPSCSGLSRTPRHVMGRGAASAPPRQRPPRTGPVWPRAPPRRTTLSGSADGVPAAAPPPGPSAPSVSAGDVIGAYAVPQPRWPGLGDAGVAAAAGSSDEDEPGLDADAPRGLSAQDEEWLAPPPPAPSSAGDAPSMQQAPPPPPAVHRRRSSGAAREPARCSSGGDALMALLMNAVRQTAASKAVQCSRVASMRVYPAG